VVWKTGPYVNVWGGEVTIEREGKTHKIRMKRHTMATNRSDSQRWLREGALQLAMLGAGPPTLGPRVRWVQGEPGFPVDKTD